LITISSNVVPIDEDEETEVARWLVNVCRATFNDWAILNGTVLKPAGTPNAAQEGFHGDHSIISVKSQIGIEVGGNKGYVHAHVVLEVAHQYLTANPGQREVGVHVNIATLRSHLTSQIYLMALPPDRWPQKIYVNSKLLTTGTDNSNKWLTYQYINKDVARDNGGGFRDLRADREMADYALLDIRDDVIGGARTEVQVQPQKPPQDAAEVEEIDNRWRQDILSRETRNRILARPPRFAIQQPLLQPPQFMRTTAAPPGPRFAPGQTNPKYRG